MVARIGLPCPAQTLRRWQTRNDLRLHFGRGFITTVLSAAGLHTPKHRNLPHQAPWSAGSMRLRFPSMRWFGDGKQLNFVFSNHNRVNLRLAYYPPYHSKYNPVERCWGAVENYWNGSLLDSVAAVLGMLMSMTWTGLHPAVELLEGVYKRGKTLTRAAFCAFERRTARTLGLDNWSFPGNL